VSANLFQGVKKLPSRLLIEKKLKRKNKIFFQKEKVADKALV
jgi:hypothetical protein